MYATKAARHHVTARQLGELSLAAPQVVAHRMTRMWLAGPVLSEHDREEFTGMVMEKQLAFTQSWFAMLAEVARIQQSVFWCFFGGSSSVWSLNPLTMCLNIAAEHNEAVHRVFSKGLGPVYRKAVSNSRRLSQTPLLAD